MTHRGLFLNVLISAVYLGTPQSAAVPRSTIEGMVTHVEGRPATGALVTLVNERDELSMALTTDEQGRFLFQPVAGRYRLIARKPGYLSTEYGAIVPGSQGLTIEANVDRRVSATLVLSPGAVIAGLVRDQFGIPSPHHRVDILKRRVTAGGVELISVHAGSAHQDAGGPITDDEGRFRVFELPAGQYLVGLDSIRDDSIAQFIRETTPTDIERAMQILREEESRGPAIAPQAPMQIPAPGMRVTIGVPRQADSATGISFVPVYFPGTSFVSDAIPITVAAGEVHDGIELQVQIGRTARVGGVIRSVSGAPVGGTVVQLVAIDPQTLARQRYVATPDGAGRFGFAAIAPGRYRLEASSQQESGLSGVKEIVVYGSDILDADVVLTTTARLSGRLSAGGVPLQGAIITISPEPLVSRSILAKREATVRADGSFEIARLVPGPYRVDVSASGTAARSLCVASVAFNGQPVSGNAVEIPAAGADVVVSLMVGASLTGVISGSDPNTNRVAVIAFPASDDGWYWNSPRIKYSATSIDGSYSITGLPPGQYVVAAVTSIGIEDLFDPVIRAAAAAAGFRVTLSQGEKRRQDFRLGR